MDLLADLRRGGGPPVIVISAREAEGQKIRLLDAGADDYLVKPFGVGEMLARVRAALRRRGHAITAFDTGWTMRCGGMQAVAVDPVTGVMTGAADPRRDGYVVAV